MMRLLLVLAASLLSDAAPPPSATNVLTIDVGNIRAAKGTVRVAVCPERFFLKDDCPYNAKAVARLGTTRVSLAGLPAGRYAVQAFLDENDNDKVDRALFGIPKEGVGFSNDAKINFAPPKFAEAAFDYNGSGRTIGFKLRYFLGPSGPPAKR
jgi:uncharacterized protein (DUF2141 family)